MGGAETARVYDLSRGRCPSAEVEQFVQGLLENGTFRGRWAANMRVEFVKEQLIFSGGDTPMATLLLSVMGAFAEFERALLRDRQREGIALAQQRGAYRGRKPALNQEQIAQLIERAAAGHAKAVLAREFGISRETVYQYLRAAAGERGVQ